MAAARRWIGAPGAEAGARWSPRKLLRAALVLALAAGAAAWASLWWQDARGHASTENAYVNADIVEISAQVTGAVERIYVRDNQHVEAGQRLFDIDPRAYRAALDKARAELARARQAVEGETAAIAAAEAQVAQRRAELVNARANDARMQKLVAQGFLSAAGAEAARTQLATADAALNAAEANLEEARSKRGESGERNAAVRAAEAAVEQAELDLERTQVRAPAAGTVANLSLRPGNTVQPGAPLFAIIGEREFWVDANFKETQLKRIAPGQPAEVELDMYPGHIFHGVVESVSGGSGAAFSLLPPQNATGNWVKVTQRVPVRVRITDRDPRYPLRVGTTATVTVALQAAPARG